MFDGGKTVTIVNTTPRQVVLGCVRADRASHGEQICKSIPHGLVLTYSFLHLVPDLSSLMMDWNLRGDETFPPQLLLVMILISVIEGKLKHS